MERKWWTLIAVCVAIFMLLLDIVIVNVALPTIEADLHASFSDIQWVINAYALTLASLLLTAGGACGHVRAQVGVCRWAGVVFAHLAVVRNGPERLVLDPCARW
jgi:MFS family permease